DLLRSGQLDDALSQLEQALKFNPADAQTENDLGAVLVQKGDSDAAIPHFQKAVELDPTSALAEFNLGNVFREKGQADEAIRHYDNGLQLTDDPGVESAVGRLLLKKKRWNDAAARFERALKLDPSLTRAQEGAAYVVWALATSPDRSVRDGPKAMELARRADQLAGGKNPIVTAALAAACAETGRFPDAVANAELALRLAREQNQTNLVPIIQKQLRCYQAATPFRDPSLSR
ncbi:MAG TPA: tetratricopeptide repeat protein, partial [Verrucomicrobiae bacterium]|nr:tetratricopeptide repeat protein [Verrucomicrobiae bacterium]